MTKAVKYVAAPTHVREVLLRGTADLPFWKSRLLNYELTPDERDGSAQILVVAANMAYGGVRFTEVSFSVEVVPPEHTAHPNAAFLIHAFISSRIFAVCERTFFRTPYYHADCRISTSSPVSIQLFDGTQPTFQAKMQADSSTPGRAPSQSGMDVWEGPIFLPKKRSDGTNKGLMFFGKMEGHVKVFPFRQELDTISIVPSRHAEVFQSLIDSNFIGEEWSVKENATHARSKTFPRQ